MNRRDFVKGTLLGSVIHPLSPTWASSGIGHAVSAPQKVEASSLAGSRRWQNWAGNIECNPLHRYQPKSPDELQKIIRSAFRLRVAGSGHSFNDIVQSNDAIVLTDKLNHVVSVDRARKQVRVQAGMKLSELNEVLDKAGLALPSLGDIDKQSIAGAISTATHGTGMAWGSISGSVSALSVFDTNGELHEFDESTADIDLLRASLGSAGIINEVTLNAVDAHHLEYKTRVLDIGDALNPGQYRNNDHFEFFFLPFTDKAYCLYRNITNKPISGNQIKNWIENMFIENLLLDLVYWIDSGHPERIPKTMKSLVSLMDESESVNKSYKIMVSSRTLKFYEMEYAIPIANAAAGVAAVQEAINFFAYSADEEDRYFAHMPIEVRFMRGDHGVALSPTANRDTCFIAVHNSVHFGGYQKFFAEVERRMRALDGRPHWGKQFFVNPADRYPQLQRLVDLRMQLDPKNKLVNAYLDRLLEGMAGR